MTEAALDAVAGGLGWGDAYEVARVSGPALDSGAGSLCAPR